MATNYNLQGQRFGRWVVLERSPKKGGHATWWKCRCDCGTVKEVNGYSLLRGDSKSCGCYHREQASIRGRKLLTKHGWYGTRVYEAWKRAKDRCENPRVEQYHNYGGRGIKMCQEWRESPQAFCEWAMANGYADNLSLDRIDPNGDYEPSNCRWITMSEQQTNKRNNVLITYKGKTQCVAEWARELGVTQQNLYVRIRKGWTDPYEILFGRRKKGVVYGN